MSKIYFITISKNMSKKRYKEKYKEGSEVLWPSEEEDKINRNFYRDLSQFSKKNTLFDNKKFSFIKKIFRLVIRKEGSPRSKK